MRTPTLAAGILAAALVLPTAHAAAHTSARPGPVTLERAAKVRPRSNAWEAKVLKLTNARRKAHGVRPLRAAKCPDHFAETWTRHMARTGAFHHQSLTPFFKRCHGVHIVGENIAAGYPTPRQLVSGWMHSEGHRANILNPAFHRIGISGWRSRSGTTYATQDFVG